MTQRDGSPTLLIFDLDGTLYRTESSFLPTMRAVYARHGLPYVGDAAVLNMVGETFSTFVDWLAGQGFSADAQSLSDEIAGHESSSIVRHGELYPGVAATLRELDQSGYVLAICTNGDLSYTRTVLGKFGLFEIFDAVQTHGDAGLSKREMIRALLEQFRPAHACMIGDRHHDFVAGRANGCTVIATAYGFASEGEADDVDGRLESFSQLPGLLAELLRAD